MSGGIEIQTTKQPNKQTNQKTNKPKIQKSNSYEKPYLFGRLAVPN